MRVVCVCNYGSVRSVTMAKSLNDKGYALAWAVGLVNFPIHYLDASLSGADKIILCNEVEVGEDLVNENCPDFEPRLYFLNKYKDKIIKSGIGRDTWGKANHPELRKICDEFTEKHFEVISK